MSFKIFKKTLSLFFSKKLITEPNKRNRVIITTILLLIDVCAINLLAYSSKIIVNSLYLNKLYNALIVVCLLVTCLVLTKIIAHIQEIVFFPIINVAIRDVTYKVVEHLHNISLIKYQQLSLPEALNSIRRIGTSARVFIKTLVLTIIPAIVKLFITIGIIINIGAYNLLWLFVLLVSTFILYKASRWYIVARHNAWQITDQVIARINDSIVNTKIVRACLMTEMNEIMDILNKEAACWRKTNIKLHTAYIKVFLILGIGVTFTLSIGVYYIGQSKLTVGDFVFLQAQLISALVPFKNFTIELRKILESLVDIKKVLTILEIPKKNDPVCVYNSNYGVDKIVVLNKVYFSYPNKKQILENFSLTINAGEKIIINGANGSGKSTLVNLIAGLYDPTKGQIFIDGNNTQNINKQSLLKTIYCIQQDFRLFNNSLFYNITYGIKDCTKEHINNFLTAFKFVDFIKQLPLGLDTKVGEMGSNLSAGERQKIAILRALLMRPKILILDETTSSLSSEEEQHILNLLCLYIPTIILISHRAISLDCKTRIINMQIVENNTLCKVAAYC